MIHVIFGPVGSGKTARLIELGKRLDSPNRTRCMSDPAARAS